MHLNEASRALSITVAACQTNSLVQILNGSTGPEGEPSRFQNGPPQFDHFVVQISWYKFRGTNLKTSWYKFSWYKKLGQTSQWILGWWCSLKIINLHRTRPFTMLFRTLPGILTKLSYKDPNQKPQTKAQVNTRKPRRSCLLTKDDLYSCLCCRLMTSSSTQRNQYPYQTWA